jgi:hypothetical protein
VLGADAPGVAQDPPEGSPPIGAGLGGDACGLSPRELQ